MENSIKIILALLIIVVSDSCFLSTLKGQNVGINDDGSVPTSLLHVKRIGASSNIILFETTQTAQEVGLEMKSGTAGSDWKMYVPASSTSLRQIGRAHV